MTHPLARVNVGRILGPMDGPVMAEFKRALDPINLLAERSPVLEDGAVATSRTN